MPDDEVPDGEPTIQVVAGELTVVEAHDTPGAVSCFALRVLGHGEDGQPSKSPLLILHPDNLSTFLGDLVAFARCNFPEATRDLPPL